MPSSERAVAASVARRQYHPWLARTRGTAHHGESDGLPGAIADRYTARWWPCNLPAPAPTSGARRSSPPSSRPPLCEAVFERADSEVRGREGLEPVTGCGYGVLPDEALTIVENGFAWRSIWGRPPDRLLSRPT